MAGIGGLLSGIGQGLNQWAKQQQEQQAQKQQMQMLALTLARYKQEQDDRQQKQQTDDLTASLESGGITPIGGGGLPGSSPMAGFGGGGQSSPGGGSQPAMSPSMQAAPGTSAPSSGADLGGGLSAGGALTRDQTLDLIEQDESGGRNIPNYRYDSGHTAQGYDQITDTNWRNLAPGLGVTSSHAMDASHDDQRRVADKLLGPNMEGVGNWSNFNPKLKADLAARSRDGELSSPSSRVAGGGTQVAQAGGTQVESLGSSAAPAGGTTTDAGPPPTRPNYDQIKAAVIQRAQQLGQQRGLPPATVNRAIAASMPTAYAHAEKVYNDQNKQWNEQRAQRASERAEATASRSAGTAERVAAAAEKKDFGSPSDLMDRWHTDYMAAQPAGKKHEPTTKEIAQASTRIKEGELGEEKSIPSSWAGMPNKPPPDTYPQHIWSFAVANVLTGVKPALPWTKSAERTAYNNAIPAAQYALGVEPSEQNKVWADYAALKARETSIERAFAGGPIGKNMISLNTLADHIPLMRQYVEALKAGQFPLANGIMNRAWTGTGHPEVTNFNTGKQILADEIVRLMTQSGGDTKDREDMKASFADYSSPEQLNGALNTAENFVAGRYTPLEQDYARGDPKKEQYFQTALMTPQARELFANHREMPSPHLPAPTSGPQTPGAQGGAPPGGGSQPPGDGVVIQNGMRFNEKTGEFLGQVQ